jgi:hypothetical protein
MECLSFSPSLSLGFYEGKLEEGPLYWGPRGICQIRLWKWASVSIGAPFWGTWEDDPFPGPSREGRNFSFH